MRVSSSSALERSSHSRHHVSQSVSHDRMVDQSSHSSHGHSSSQSGPHSGSHGIGSTQSQADASQRVPVRARVESVAVEQVPPSEAQNKSQNASMDVDSGEIEMAEEATSEMAFQTLHQTDPSGRRDSGSQEANLASQEIPLEDLSRKNRSKKKLLSRARLTKTRLNAELRHEQLRSQSHSPKRTVKSDSALRVKDIERVRSSSFTETSQKEQHVIPSRRAHSDSSPPRSEAKHGHGKKKKSVSTQVQTKLVMNPNIKHPAVIDKEVDTEVDKGPRPSPKTLTPSQSPAVSLVPEVEDGLRSKLAEAPKLVPPVEAGRIRSLSEASTSSNDDAASIGSRLSTESQEQPRFGFHAPSQAEPVLSSAKAEVKSTNKDMKATTDQLTKLAQMVQHYRFDQEEETEFTEADKK